MANQNKNDKSESLHIKKALVEGEPPKDSAVKRAAKVFFSEDIDHVTDSIMDDFVKPRTKSFGLDLVRKIKEFVYDSTKDFIGRLLFGSSGSVGGSKYYSSSGSTYTSYATKFTDEYVWEDGRYVKATRSNLEYRDRVHERPLRYGEATEVLNELKAVIKKYGKAYVADYYSAVKMDITNSRDYDFCWKGNMLDSIKEPKITGSGYYILNLPRPVPVED